MVAECMFKVFILMHFLKVNPDQSQELINGMGKKAGGIFKITKTITADELQV